MGEPVDLVIDPVTREKLRIELPLRIEPDTERLRSALGVPTFVDLSDPLVAKALALEYWAQQNGKSGPALAFLGGVAHRLRCASSNDGSSGLRRSLHDLDVACLHREIRATVAFLKSVGDHAGSGVKVFETPGDRVFNSLQGGRRQRYHTLLAPADGGIALGIVDLLADEFEFCHRLDLRADVSAARERGYTLSLALLLLAKLQYIQRIPATDGPRVSDRVLEPFGKHELLIGAESKDMQDVLAILADHDFGDDANSVSLTAIDQLLHDDWGLWKTVGLNLDAIQRSRVLTGVRADLRERILPRLATLRERVRSLSPKRRFGFFQPQWWQQVDSAGPSPTSAAVDRSNPS